MTETIPRGVADVRPDVLLVCDVCMETKINLGHVLLNSYAPHERYAAVRTPAESRGWKVRNVRAVWQCVCPACLAEEAEKQAKCEHHNRICTDCGKVWTEAEPMKGRRSWLERIKAAWKAWRQ